MRPNSVLIYALYRESSQNNAKIELFLQLTHQYLENSPKITYTKIDNVTSCISKPHISFKLSTQSVSLSCNINIWSSFCLISSRVDSLVNVYWVKYLKAKLLQLAVPLKFVKLTIFYEVRDWEQKICLEILPFSSFVFLSPLSSAKFSHFSLSY